MNPFQSEINRKLLKGFGKICLNPQGLENWISCKSAKQNQPKNAQTQALCKGKMVGRLLKKQIIWQFLQKGQQRTSGNMLRRDVG